MTPPINPILDRLSGFLKKVAEARTMGAAIDSSWLEAECTELWPREKGAAVAALTDPFLAVTMLKRVIDGFRGNPHHLRPLDTDGVRLAADLLTHFRMHLRLRRGLDGLVDWPAYGLPGGDLEGAGGWCDLCGECCVHCGTVPNTPPGVDYPAYFYHAISGGWLSPQFFCPFLFETRDSGLFFCGLHPVKPLSCSRFDLEDCERGRPGRGTPAK